MEACCDAQLPGALSQLHGASAAALFVCKVVVPRAARSNRDHCDCLLLQTEAQRWVEKLHTLYSSGAVVPLPFLRATDAAPLALLGIDKGPPGAPPAAAAAEAQVCWRSRAGHSRAGQAWQSGGLLAGASRSMSASRATCMCALTPLPLQELGWEQALQEVVAESGNGSSEEGVGELPEAIVTAVAGSPALLNLAASLAHHKRLLAALAAQQAAAGDALPARLREQLRAKADDLATTLRTILCL